MTAAEIRGVFLWVAPGGGALYPSKVLPGNHLE